MATMLWGCRQKLSGRCSGDASGKRVAGHVTEVVVFIHVVETEGRMGE